MKILSETISNNLDLLERAKVEFPILIEFQKAVETSKLQPSFQNINKVSVLKDECRAYNLTQFALFIEFCVETQYSGQEVFYRKKIKVKEFQEMLVKNATDDDAKKSLKSKSQKSFTNFINSKKWDVFSANVTNRRRKFRRLNDNLKQSEAIIANFVIQNEIDVVEYKNRIGKFYLQRLPEVDTTIKLEISRTKEIINFIVEKLSESGSDFRKVNYDRLTKTLSDELLKKVIAIDPGEKIKCIDLPLDVRGLTLHKTYDVVSKQLDSGILKVTILNDNEVNFQYNYRLFETVSNLRNSALDNLLNEI